MGVPSGRANAWDCPVLLVPGRADREGGLELMPKFESLHCHTLDITKLGGFGNWWLLGPCCPLG